YHNYHSYMDNRGAPYLDQLVFTNIPVVDTQLAAIETGEVDVVNLPPREVKRFQADPAYQVYITPTSTGIAYLEFSRLKPPKGQSGVTFLPPFDDIRLRQAVGYTLDVDTIIASVLEGLAVRNYGPIAPGLFAYNPAIEQYGFHHEPDKAKALLD